MGGIVLGLDLIGIEPDFHVFLFSVWLAVAALLAGLVLSFRGETATRDLGRLTYQCVSLAGLGFFLFMMTALASSSALH